MGGIHAVRRAGVMAVIWRGDRVRVAVENPYAPVGTVGFYVGGYEEESDIPTVLVRVRDGREIRVPWKALESMEESVMDMNWSWKDDIPVSDYRHHIHTVDQARTNHGAHYETARQLRTLVHRLHQTRRTDQADDILCEPTHCSQGLQRPRLRSNLLTGTTEQPRP
jgi:hypothetical protein